MCIYICMCMWIGNAENVQCVTVAEQDSTRKTLFKNESGQGLLEGMAEDILEQFYK